MADQNQNPPPTQTTAIATQASTAPLTNPSEIGNDANGIQRVPAREGTNIVKMSEPLDENNWTVWKERMKRALRLCGIEDYAYGKIKRPDDPIQANNWDYNDNYAQFVIINNITSTEMLNVGKCPTAYAIWQSLEAMHETKGHQTIIGIIRNLFRTIAEEDTNISEHLNALKSYWERLNMIDDDDFKISDKFFKVMISSSLPITWDTFTEAYVGGRKGEIETDQKKLTTSTTFIGIIKEEYLRRVARTQKTEQGSPSNTNQAIATNKGRSLASRLGQQPRINQSRPTGNMVNRPYTGGRTSTNGARYGNTTKLGQLHCRNCELDNHNTEDCRYLGDRSVIRCSKCKTFGHVDKDCWGKDGPKRRRNNRNDGRYSGNKRSRTDQTNEGIEQTNSGIVEIDENSDQQITFGVQEGEIWFDESEVGQYSGFKEYEESNENDERVLYYDWLADSATTSHICNDRQAFINYSPDGEGTVIGVGNIKTAIQGRGTVQLYSECEGITYSLTMENVLHIPKNKNNLISLGRWDREGRSYQGGEGRLTLFNANGIPVARGNKVKNNLYRMRLAYERKMKEKTNENVTYAAHTKSPTWEIWHKRFGHISYGGLQKIYDLDLVDGFHVDSKSDKPDCVTCTEAKMTEQPYPKTQRRYETPGILTHMDVWGKYDVISINGHQYYLLFVDDATRFTTVTFLKGKNETSQKTKQYLTYLKTQGKRPRAIRIDRGKEFLNENLKSWCQDQGIEIQATAGHSPAQNGVAERMNRTLTEITRAMLKGQNAPEFLWELAVEHAAYIRNQAYTKSLKEKTPYEAWFGNKPNIKGLHEFGAQVWVLLQGQKMTRKLMPKSQRRMYVGYEDGPKAIKYYSAETRKILTSRNYRFLSLLEKEDPPPEGIVVAPDVPREGESRGCALPMSLDTQRTVSKSQKRKHEDQYNEPRKTRGKRPNYKQMNDPFSEEEEVEENVESGWLSVAINEHSGKDEPKSLAVAKKSLEWPQWEYAIREELAQLLRKGTWKLTNTPAEAIPIMNKWVFTKKYNKEGDLIKYKARLVVKGCAQRPGYDYDETFAPVVRLETIRTILALSVAENLVIRQMDVKGAYLNGNLNETVYMHQPEGYEDKTGRTCLLKKTLYGLKQAGREWNKELDRKLHKHDFKRLRSDPCVYTRGKEKMLEIITVWVDDLLLFASTQQLCDKMKKNLRSEWEVTDLGEPSKIIGIEIAREKNSITISQKQYIQNILVREGMERANPVAMPMDPNLALEKNPDGQEGNRSNSYAKLLGELQFLANATRPDIAYAVNRLATYTANPSLQHNTALKRILRYLAGTKNFGITYRNSKTSFGANSTYGFADAAYANTDDLKSTSGYVFLSEGGAITWRSKKQTTIALSSTEAEYVALSEAGREACWLRNLYDELGYKQKIPTIIKGDNDGSIMMARNPQFHKRSKHIDTRWHWIRDLVENNVVRIESCRDPEQTADVLTKALAKPKHTKHVEEMGLMQA